MAKQEILDYANECGKEAAENLLILVGPDGFDGSYAEYEALEAELNQYYTARHGGYDGRKGYTMATKTTNTTLSDGWHNCAEREE